MNEEPPAKRLRLGKLWWWLLAIFLGACGWQMWSIHKYNAAVREAEEAGFAWECTDTIRLIRQDWRNALKKETWCKHTRMLVTEDIPDLGRYREMLHQLRPTALIAWRCKDKNVDALKGLTALQSLNLLDCPALQNVDALKGLTALQVLGLNGCTTLQNVDGLKGLTELQILHLSGCTALQNVDALKGLTNLRTLSLHDCDKIPAAALRELRAALPNTYITFPDGSENPPQ